jgi:hypothetical protein
LSVVALDADAGFAGVGYQALRIEIEIAGSHHAARSGADFRR